MCSRFSSDLLMSPSPTQRLMSLGMSPRVSAIVGYGGVISSIDEIFLAPWEETGRNTGLKQDFNAYQAAVESLWRKSTRRSSTSPTAMK